MHTIKEQKIESTNGQMGVKLGSSNGNTCSDKNVHLKKTSRLSFDYVRNCWAQVTVEPVLFLYMLATFALYALFQDLVYTKICLSRYDPSVCDHNNLHLDKHKEQLDFVQKWSSHYILLSTVSLTVPSILMSIYLGSWSDRFGRKWPVVIPPLGGALSCLVYIVISFEPKAHVAWICLASLVSGICGGFACCILGCMSYVASICDIKNRTTRISRLEAMLFLGGTIGPFISGSMLEGLAFLFMMACYFMAFLYAILFVQEISGDPEPKIHQQLPSSSNVSTTTTASHSLLDEQKSGLLLHHNNENGPQAQGRENGSLKTTGNGKNRHPSSTSKTSDSTTNSNSNGNGNLNGLLGLNHDDLGGLVDDEKRNIIICKKKCRNRRDSDEESVEKSKSWCCTYFGSQHFVDALRTAFMKRDGNGRTTLILVILTMMICMMITAGELDVSYLFAKDKSLRWDYKTYSYYFGLKYGLGALVLLLGMPLLQRLKWEDTSICLLGLFSRVAGLILYGLSNSTIMAFSAPVLAIFSFFTLPATRSLLSKLVRPSEQGKMFAFVAIIEDICTMTASIIFNSLYPITRDLFPGGIFILGAVLLFIPILIMWYVRVKIRRENLLLTLNEENPQIISSQDQQNTGIP